MNARIPTYWFWFAVSFGAICLIPCLGRGDFRIGGFILATAYTTLDWRFPWQTILVVHTVVATALGSIATVLCHLWGRCEGVAYRHRVHTTYGTRGLFTSMAIFAIAFGVLSWAQASPVVFVCVLVAAAGQPCAAFAVRWWERRTRCT